MALIKGGPTGERIHIPDAYPKVREAVLHDTDVAARFIGLRTLALTTREKEYLPETDRWGPKLPRGRIWQLEDLLLQFAGSHPKGGRFLKTPESLARAGDSWLSWWKEKGEAIDFVRFDYKERVAGFTDILELDASFIGPGGWSHWAQT